MSVSITRTGPWLQLAKPAGRGNIHFSVSVNDAHDMGRSILDGIECWGQHGVTSTTVTGQLTLAITRHGKVRLSQELPDGDERWMMLDQAEAVDLAALLVEAVA